MKIISPVVLGLSLAVVGSTLSAAQDASSTSTLPKILQFTMTAGIVNDRREVNPHHIFNLTMKPRR